MPELRWIGKQHVQSYHKDVPYHFLNHVYSYDQSGRKDAEGDSGNKIIHGDNLMALKACCLSIREKSTSCSSIRPITRVRRNGSTTTM